MSDLGTKLIVTAFTCVLTFCTGLLTKLITDLRAERKKQKEYQENQKKEMVESFVSLKSEVDSISAQLKAHIDESNERDIRTRRTAILDFANSCMNGRNHTKEEFDFFITEAQIYENYCKENNVDNGVADHAIKFINNLYDKKLDENSFLQ